MRHKCLKTTEFHSRLRFICSHQIKWFLLGASHHLLTSIITTSLSKILEENFLMQWKDESLVETRILTYINNELLIQFYALWCYSDFESAVIYEWIIRASLLTSLSTIPAKAIHCSDLVLNWPVYWIWYRAYDTQPYFLRSNKIRNQAIQLINVKCF